MLIGSRIPFGWFSRSPGKCRFRSICFHGSLRPVGHDGLYGNEIEMWQEDENGAESDSIDTYVTVDDVLELKLEVYDSGISI